METCLTVNWRSVPSQRNSYAVLAAACEMAGFDLVTVKKPCADITCYSLNSIVATAYTNEIRDAPCTTILGGPHATACWQDLTKIADYVIVGEGEWALPALLLYLESGGGLPPGVATKDEYRPPDHQVFLDAYPCFSRVRGYLEISRGCPYRCAYCQTPRIFGMSMRHRGIDTLVRDAKRLTQVRFVTPNAFAYGSSDRNPHLDRIKKLLTSFPGKEVYFGTFPGEVRPEWISDRILEIVGETCANTKIHLGAQSGSDTVLERISRGHTSGDVYRAVDCCVDHGFIPIVDVILGLPGETEKEQLETLRLIHWVTRRGMVHAHRFIPLPGTPLWGQVPAGLLPEAEKVLGSLALAGKVTGGWSDPALRFKTIPANRYEL